LRSVLVKARAEVDAEAERHEAIEEKAAGLNGPASDAADTAKEPLYLKLVQAIKREIKNGRRHRVAASVRS